MFTFITLISISFIFPSSVYITKGKQATKLFHEKRIADRQKLIDYAANEMVQKLGRHSNEKIKNMKRRMTVASLSPVKENIKK